MEFKAPTFALYALVYKSVQQRTAVITKCGACVGVNFEFVG